MPTSLTSAHQVRQALLRRFARNTETVPTPEHLVVFEVAVDGRERAPGVKGMEGVLTRQRIDAVAVGLAARTEHLVHGFEIKVSRSDLLHELRDPTKAQAAVAMCDRWWLALGDARLLRDGDDLPQGWGVIAPVGRGLRVLAEPAARSGMRDTRFWAAVLQAELRSPRFRFDLGRQAGRADGERWVKVKEKQTRWHTQLEERARAIKTLQDDGHFEAARVLATKLYGAPEAADQEGRDE